MLIDVYCIQIAFCSLKFKLLQLILLFTYPVLHTVFHIYSNLRLLRNKRFCLAEKVKTDRKCIILGFLVHITSAAGYLNGRSFPQ